MKKFALLPLFAAFCLAAANVLAEDGSSNPIFLPSLPFLENPVKLAESEAANEKEMKPYVEKIPGTDQSFKMIPIPGGKFKMGGTREKEQVGSYKGESIIITGKETPSFEVEIKPFWMEEHETSWKEFVQYAGKDARMEGILSGNPRDDRTRKSDAFVAPTPAFDQQAISYDRWGQKDYPASGMTQYAAAAYCKWLTFRTGRYYRLPTEAEWEYACRAGAATPYSFGDDEEKLDDYAWYFDNTLDNVQPGYCKIKLKKPNKFGLYDMHGNVAEWVIGNYTNDSYEKFAKGELPKMFTSPVGHLNQIARGGSCDHEAEDCTSSVRFIHNKQWKAEDPQIPQSVWWVTDAPFVGFRVVRPLEPPKTDEEAALYEPDPKIWQEYYLNTNKKE